MGAAERIKLNSFDSLFGNANTETKTEIRLDELYPFKDHPFKVIDDEKMEELVESIKANGVLNPAIVRPLDSGGYELISGHRRKHACELAGLKTLPAFVKDLSDDEATIIMVDSNIQREELLPSEKAYSYKMRLEAMKKKAGRKSKNIAQIEQAIDDALTNFYKAADCRSYKCLSKAEKADFLKKHFGNSHISWSLNNNPVFAFVNTSPKEIVLKPLYYSSGDFTEKSFTWSKIVEKIDRRNAPKASVEILAEEVGESRASIQRLIRLTLLSENLMELVDTKKLPVNVGVELSYIPEEGQAIIEKFISSLEVFPSIKQAKRLREYSENGKLTQESAEAILTETAEKTVSLSFGSEIKKYFPENYGKKEMQEYIIKLLEKASC